MGLRLSLSIYWSARTTNYKRKRKAKLQLIQKTEKPEGNLVPQHILLVGRGDEAVGNAGNLLAVLGTPADLNRVLMIDGEVGRCLAVFHHMGC